MLTDKPPIVIARAPRRTPKPKPGPKIRRVIVGPRGRERVPEISQEEYERTRQIGCWRELVRRVENGAER